MTNIFNYLLILNIFGGGFVLFRKPFEFYIGYIFILLFLIIFFVIKGNIVFNKKFIFVLVLLTFTSIISVFLGYNNYTSLFKQVAGILINGIAYYLLFYVNNFDFKKLFRIYLKVAFIIALIAVFQEIFFLIGFRSGYNFSYFIPKYIFAVSDSGLLRVSSILTEPSHFVVSISPAIFISILNLIQSKKYFFNRTISFIIILSVLLTFSLLGYAAIIISFVLILLNYKKKKMVVFALLFILLFAAGTYFIPTIKYRVDSIYNVLSEKESIEHTNFSVYSIFSNAYVTYKSFINSYMFGFGLGSYESSFNRYIEEYLDRNNPDFLILQKKDANSLMLRLYAETGLIGVLSVFYFISTFYISRNRHSFYWIMSHSVLLVFIVCLIRQGNYFYNGFFFFIWLFYFVGTKKKESIASPG